MFVDRPREFIVQFACDKTHKNGAHEQHTRDYDLDWNEPGSYVGIDKLVELQVRNGIIHLLRFCGTKDHQTKIAKAKADELNGISHAEGVPDENQEVKHAEEIYRGHDRNSSCVGRVLNLVGCKLVDILLEYSKRVTSSS